MAKVLPAVEYGSDVTLHLRICLAAGQEVESSYGDEPVHVIVGDGTLDPGVEEVLSGMHAGDHREVRLSPDQAYGRRDEANVHQLPRTEFPPDAKLEPGLIWSFDTPTGVELPGLVVAVEDDLVTVDFNHPLAGHELVVETEVIAVKTPRQRHFVSSK